MRYYVRFMGYNRWTQPAFRPLGPDNSRQEPPQFERGRLYQLNLLDLPTDVSTWPEFVVVRTNSQTIAEGHNESATLVEEFVVLLAEWQEYVEPSQPLPLN